MTNLEKLSKIVVFDMDETLGYFVEFGIFWDALIAYIKSTTENDEIPKKLEQYQLLSHRIRRTSHVLPQRQQKITPVQKAPF